MKAPILPATIYGRRFHLKATGERRMKLSFPIHEEPAATALFPNFGNFQVFGLLVSKFLMPFIRILGVEVLLGSWQCW